MDMYLFKSSKNTFLGLTKPVPERCMSWTFPEIFYWKSKIKNVVKHDVHLDILLVGFIYVTTCAFSRKTRNPRHPANPVIQA